MNRFLFYALISFAASYASASSQLATEGADTCAYPANSCLAYMICNHQWPPENCSDADEFKYKNVDATVLNLRSTCSVSNSHRYGPDAFIIRCTEQGLDTDGVVRSLMNRALAECVQTEPKQLSETTVSVSWTGASTSASANFECN